MMCIPIFRVLRSPILVVMVAMASFMTPGMSSAQSFNLYVYSPVNTSPSSRGQIAMIEQIEKETNGQLKIRMHLGGSLPINATNITAAVSDNIVQMADDAFVSGSIPIVEALRLPRLFRNEKEMAMALKIMDPYVRREYEKRGIELLSAYLYPDNVVWSKNKVTSLADLKNQKIRITTQSQGVFLRAFGAVPVTLGTAEVASALERSVVDGVVTASLGGAFIFKDYLKYSYRINIGSGQSYLIVNREAFQKLPAGTQAIVRRAAIAGCEAITEQLWSEDGAMTEKLKAGGITTVAPSPSDEAEADKQMKPHWDEWAKKTGPVAVEMLKKIRDALGR